MHWRREAGFYSGVQTLSQIRQLLEERGLSPRKALGQNFLVDHNLLTRLVDAARVGPGSVVLEVGPGTGTLTEELLARGARVVAVELDRALVDLLRERFAAAIASGRLSLVEGDALECGRRVNAEALAALGPGPFKLVANLPYNAGTPLMMALLLRHPECMGFWVTIQREVGDRLLASPGSKDYGPLTVVSQALARVSKLATLSPECFWPRPEVTSVMVSVERRADPLTEDAEGLEAFCRVAFAHRRKQLGSALGRDFPWPEGVEARHRAEEVAVPRLIELASRWLRA